MPYISNNINIEGSQYDRRKKINDTQREEIKRLRLSGLTYREIAEMYKCHRETIINICNPDIAEQKRIADRERRRKRNYTQAEKAAIQREHRAYKHKLHKEGKI